MVEKTNDSDIVEPEVESEADLAMKSTVNDILKISSHGFILFSVAFFIVVLGLSYNQGIIVIAFHPSVFMIPIAGFLLWGISNSVKLGVYDLIEQDELVVKEFSSIFHDSSDYENQRIITLSEIQPSKTSQVTIVAIAYLVLTYGIHTIRILLGQTIVVSYSIIYIVVWAYWLLFIVGLQSCYRIGRILTHHVKNLFDDALIFSLHRFQDRIITRSARVAHDDTPTANANNRRRSISLKITSSHHNIRNTATKLARKTRGIVIVFLAFVVELFIFLVLLNNPQTISNDAYSGLNIVLVIIFFQLFAIMIFMSFNYGEIEFAIHNVLDKSKRNFVELSDLLIVKTGLDYIDGTRSGENSKRALEVSEKFLDYFSKLPTWTLDSKIVISIGSGLTIQIIAIVITILNILMNQG